MTLPSRIPFFVLGILTIETTVVAQVSTRYGGDHLLLGAGARPLGMGSAFVAISDDATAIYWNPAGLARLSHREIQIQHAEQFGGTVNHDVFTLAGQTSVGGIGIGLLRLGVDKIPLTTLENPSRNPSPDNRPIITEFVGTSDYNLYFSYGHLIRSNFSIGASLKLIWRKLIVGNGSGYGIDFGLLYTPGRGFFVGLVGRDLTPTKISYDSGATDQIPPSLMFGMAYHYSLKAINSRLTLSISTNIGEEKSTIEDLEEIQIGLEYKFKNLLAFRAGADGDHLTAGAGLRFHPHFGLDLAFLENGQLDNTYRISASFYF